MASLDQKIKDLIKQRQKEEEEKVKQQQQNQPKVGFWDVVKELPHGAVETAKGIGRGGKAVAKAVTSGTRQFGDTIGSTLALPEQQRMLEEQNRFKDEQQRKLVEAIRRNKAQGKDSTGLMRQYQSLTGSVPDIQELNPVINKSNKQVLGEAASFGLELTGGASFGGAASKAKNSFSLTKSLAPEFITAGAKQVTRAAAAKAAAKSVAVGAGQGYLYDVSSNLQQNKSGKEIFKPGMGTLIGGGIPAVTGAIGLTRTEVALQIDDLVKKGFSKEEAKKVVSEGGYIRLFQSPKMTELGDKINELNAKMVDAPNKMLYNRYKKAYDQAVEVYKKESQGGFIGKNPFEEETAAALSSADDLLKKEKPPVQGPNVASEMKDVSTFYNVNRLDIPDAAKESIKSEIQGASKQLKETVGTRLSNKEVLDLARDTSKILDTTVTREETAAKIASNLKLRQKIANVAAGGKIDGDLIDLVLKDKAAGEDIARQLQARVINADPKEATAFRAIIDSIYKVNKNADAIKKAAEGVDFNDPEQVQKFYRTFIRPNAGEWIDALRYNSMLSSPTTHLVNISSNFQGTGVLAPIEKTITGVLDATRSALTGKPRSYAVGEGAAYAKGYYKNIGTASKRFMQVIRGTKVFDYNPDIPVQSQIPLTTGKVARAGENVLKFPMRMLEAADQFFSAMTEGGLESSMAYRASKGIGSPDDIAKETARRLFRGELHSSEQGYILNAIDDVTGKISMLRHSDNPVTSTIAKMTFPFLRTPMNILKQGIEYNPVAGFATLPGAKNKTEQLSKMIIGAGSAMAAATILGQDRLTWGAPTSEKEKAAFYASGRKPYSIKIGNKWVSYSKLHPAVAFNLAMMAAIDDAKKNKGLDDSAADQILEGLSKVPGFFADQSYLKNIGDLLAGIRGEDSAKSKLISNYWQQVVPFRALSGYIERIVDPKMRQIDNDASLPEKQIQSLFMQIPGLADRVPARLGPLGAPITSSKEDRFWNAISPNQISTQNNTYNGLYKIDQFERKMDRFDDDLDAKIEKLIRKRMLQAK